jgi:hypothetical protein
MYTHTLRHTRYMKRYLPGYWFLTKEPFTKIVLLVGTAYIPTYIHMTYVCSAYKGMLIHEWKKKLSQSILLTTGT